MKHKFNNRTKRKCQILNWLILSYVADRSADRHQHFGSVGSLFGFHFYRNDIFVRNVNQFWHRFRLWVFLAVVVNEFFSQYFFFSRYFFLLHKLRICIQRQTAEVMSTLLRPQMIHELKQKVKYLHNCRLQHCLIACVRCYLIISRRNLRFLLFFFSLIFLLRVICSYVAKYFSTAVILSVMCFLFISDFVFFLRFYLSFQIKIFITNRRNDFSQHFRIHAMDSSHRTVCQACRPVWSAICHAIH